MTRDIVHADEEFLRQQALDTVNKIVAANRNAAKSREIAAFRQRVGDMWEGAVDHICATTNLQVADRFELLRLAKAIYRVFKYKVSIEEITTLDDLAADLHFLANLHTLPKETESNESMLSVRHARQSANNTGL